MFLVKVPKFMEAGNIRLVPFGLRDARVIRDEINPVRNSCGVFISPREINPDGNLRRKRRGIISNRIKNFHHPEKGLAGSLSLLSFWLWLRKTYDICYRIELESRTIGFIGLYNLEPGDAAEISLAIFNKDDRRQSYGKQAFDLLAQNLKKYHVVEEIRARVRIDNFTAISFWKRMGFDELYSRNGIKTIALDLRGK